MNSNYEHKVNVGHANLTAYVQVDRKQKIFKTNAK